MAADFKTGTNLAGKILAQGQLASGEQTVYTVPAYSATKIASAVLANTSGSQLTVAVSVVSSGGTAGGTNRIMPGYQLAAGDTTSITEIVGAFLDAGAFISINAGAGSAINYLITGVVSS